MAGTVVRTATSPAIGIAKVGNCPDRYLLAPQVPPAAEGVGQFLRWQPKIQARGGRVRPLPI